MIRHRVSRVLVREVPRDDSAAAEAARHRLLEPARIVRALRDACEVHGQAYGVAVGLIAITEELRCPPLERLRHVSDVLEAVEAVTAEP